MAHTKAVTLWCDFVDEEGERCWEWVNHDQRTVYRARKYARSDGWVFRGEKDLCPRHARGAER